MPIADLHATERTEGGTRLLEKEEPDTAGDQRDCDGEVEDTLGEERAQELGGQRDEQEAEDFRTATSTRPTAGAP